VKLGKTVTEYDIYGVPCAYQYPTNFIVDHCQLDDYWVIIGLGYRYNTFKA